MIAVVPLVGCQSADDGKEGSSETTVSSDDDESQNTQTTSRDRATGQSPVTPEVEEGLAVATFAGGCFWCMEPPFEKLDGVRSVVSGYCGGDEKEPAYKEVARGETGHAESVQITYDPDEIDYEQLLEVYWRNIDPTDSEGQFVDRGPQYRPAIFYHDADQKELAEASKRRLEESGRFDEPVVVEIVPASTFWKAEAYHQDFYKKRPGRYQSYRDGSGRDEFLRRVWKKEAD